MGEETPAESAAFSAKQRKSDTIAEGSRTSVVIYKQSKDLEPVLKDIWQSTVRFEAIPECSDRSDFVTHSSHNQNSGVKIAARRTYGPDLAHLFRYEAEKEEKKSLPTTTQTVIVIHMLTAREYQRGFVLLLLRGGQRHGRLW